jgi:WD40 repeat protein
LLAWADDYYPIIHLFDVAAWKVVHQLRGHRGQVRCLAFSQDSKLLASGRDDDTVLVWDVSRVK